MGFYGSWGDSTIFDSPDYGASKLGTSAMTFHGLPLGQLNPFAEEDEMAIHTNDRQYYIISRFDARQMPGRTPPRARCCSVTSIR